ncbi:MAG: hypothetical protein RSB67_03080 [Clostridia bacterium]
MKKTNRVISFFVIVISMALIYTLSVVLLDNSSKINQGKYRVNDIVLLSTVNVEEKNEKQEQTNISDLVLNLSQSNKISMLMSKDEKYNKMYIDNISVSNPKLLGEIYYTQEGLEDTFTKITKETKAIEIYPVEKDEQYFVEMKFENANFLKDAKIPEDINKIVYDGTILKNLNVDEGNLKFNIKFNFNIVDITGKKSVCKFNLTVPNDEISKNGINITRLDVSDYGFKLK